MSLERERGILIFTCDACGDDADVRLHDFKQAFAKIKEEGWVARKSKTSDSWFHYCPDCKDHKDNK